MIKKEGKENVIKLGFSSLFNKIGSEMIVPLLPFLITSLGGGGLIVGIISGLREGLSSIFKLTGGILSDRTGKRKEFILFGYLTSFISKLLIFFSISATQIVSLVGLERFGKLRDAPRDSIIAESTKKRGKWFGIHQSMDGVGAIIGVFLAIILITFFSFEYKSVVLCGAIISSFSIIPLFSLKVKKVKKDKTRFVNYIKTLDKKLMYFIFVSSIFALGNFGIYMFLILRAKEMTGSAIVPLVLFAIFNIFWAVFTTYFGSLSDKVGRKKIILAGYTLFFLICIGMLFQEGIVYLAILFAAYGLVYAMTNSNKKAFVFDIANKNKGKAIGTYYFCIGIASIIGGAIGGFLWEINPLIMFGYCASMAIISMILLHFLEESPNKK